MDIGDWIAVGIGLLGAISGAISIYLQLKKNPHEIGKLDEESRRIQVDAEKAKAETDDIHGKIADRWAEHVEQLMQQVSKLEAQSEIDRKELAGLRMDISQVRRENEEYRRENSDLKDWAERLMSQLSVHAPQIVPEKFIRHLYE